MLTLSETNTHSYSISHLSTIFAPDRSFLSIINQPKNPFTLTKNQLNTELTVSTRDQIISVPLSSLAKCNKFTTSNDY